MNGATAWNPAPARAGSRCSQVRAVSGNPCRHSASGPDPASSSPKSRSLARTVVMRNGTGAVMGDTLPAVRASVPGRAARRYLASLPNPAQSRSTGQHLPTPYTGDAPLRLYGICGAGFRLMSGGGFPRAWTPVPRPGNIKVLLRTLAAASRGYRGSGTGPEFTVRADAEKA